MWFAFVARHRLHHLYARWLDLDSSSFGPLEPRLWPKTSSQGGLEASIDLRQLVAIGVGLMTVSGITVECPDGVVVGDGQMISELVIDRSWKKPRIFVEHCWVHHLKPSRFCRVAVRLKCVEWLGIAVLCEFIVGFLCYHYTSRNGGRCLEVVVI